MSPRILLLAAAFALGLAACDAPSESGAPVTPAGTGEPPPPIPVRFATWNTSLFDPAAGGLIARLERGDEAASHAFVAAEKSQLVISGAGEQGVFSVIAGGKVLHF